MNRIIVTFLTIGFCMVGMSCAEQKGRDRTIVLRDGWSIQSASQVLVNGSTLSAVSYEPQNWYPVSVPSTVLAGLVENGLYPDPYYGTNIESLPGYTAQRRGEMPDDSPFRVAWWYRKEFRLPASYRGQTIWIGFQSINYRANIWMNGKLVADTTVVEGAYRTFSFDITPFVQTGKANCLALEIFPPRSNDLSITWVDWNPTPPDRGMGIWYDVTVHATGPVAIKSTRITTDLNLPSADTAELFLTAELCNASSREVSGVIGGEIEEIGFSMPVSLAPGETRLVSFTPDDFPQFAVANPRLWWPNNAGPQNLYDLTIRFETGGVVSDRKSDRFGIREISSWMNVFDDKRTTVFQVNGKNIVVRGGGYVEDMMLRPDKKRAETDILYAKHMNLNALRMEAPRGSDYVFDLCDQHGIMLIVGWCCCSTWERWNRWTPHMADIAEASWRDQVIRLRNHPCVMDWLLGSDNPPPRDIEQRYLDVLDTFDGTRPVQSSATQDSSDILGYTGLWMGPYPRVYSYFPPSYWYGKLEFNTEAGPSGEQIPPLESLRKMMPESDLWPISASWNIRLHSQFYPAAREALFSRYGTPSSVEEYACKSQIFQKEAARAMFEAFARNKYRSSGIIYWMYNSAWPAMYWQLYDYFHTPNGAFYGAREACEPLHIQYSYDDSSIYAVNGYYRDLRDCKASVSLYNLDMEKKYATDVSFDLQADESKKILDILWPSGLSDVYFLTLELSDSSGAIVSSNFYWLSAKGDEHADFSGLETLPEVTLEVTSLSLHRDDGRYLLEAEIHNPSPSLAFAVNPKILKAGSGDLVLPVYWAGNYFSLLPGETRKVTAEFHAEDLAGDKALLRLEGWNIKSLETKL